MSKYVNYYKKAGYRTSMKLSEAREKAMRFLCDYHGYKRLQDYIYYAADKNDKKENTSTVMDFMLSELVDICGGERVEILKRKLAQAKPELTEWIELNFGKVRE